VSTQPSALRLSFDRQFLAGNAGLRIATRDILPHKYGSKRLASLTMPTLLVFASNDVVHDGRKAAAKARRLLPSANVELLQECGHFMTFDRQAAVSILLTEFLSQTSAAPANNTEPTTEDG
jgi:pimeloyl-ACP methyl ester carboxylesterase